MNPPRITPEQSALWVEALPQQPPFRFVDHIELYKPGHLLIASLNLEAFRESMAGLPCFPEACVMEGLAQASILLVQLETEPLRKNEVPVLGSFTVGSVRGAGWHKRLYYEIRPVRFQKMQARTQVIAVDSRGIAAVGELSMAKTRLTGQEEA